MKQYVVDAFTDHLFGGNPAAVCVMDRWPDEELMHGITRENNLSETAFAVKEGAGYKLRWLTPGGEIDLCGHATLATSFVLMNFMDTSMTEVHFFTLSGELVVRKNGDLYEMDFPCYNLKRVDVTDEMELSIGFRPLEAWLDRDLVCVLENEKQVLTAQPNLAKTKELDGLLLHLTATGTSYDCVSRSFAPKMGVPEDPVCGSGHCHIIPLWADKLKKADLVARQASLRGGTLYCRMNGDRVSLSGKAVLYAIAELNCFYDSRAVSQF